MQASTAASYARAISVADEAHPGWVEVFAAWRRAGLARDLDRDALAPLLARAPSPGAIARVLAGHYYAGGDAVERAWRAQSDRVLELPDEPLAPEVLASAARVIVPEIQIEVLRHDHGIELRLLHDEVPLDEAPSVLLRRVRTHARRALMHAQTFDDLEPRAFVYALNVLLEEQRTPMRFVPLAALPGRRAWVGTSVARAGQLDEVGTLAPDEHWREYARFPDPLAVAC